MSGERWLTDERGDVRVDVALSVMAGEYERGTTVCYRQLRLSPVVDREPFFAVDTPGGREVDAVNAGAIRTAGELVDTLDEVQERAETGVDERRDVPEVRA